MIKIREEKYHEANDIENTAIQILWDAVKSVLDGSS